MTHRNANHMLAITKLPLGMKYPRCRELRCIIPVLLPPQNSTTPKFPALHRLVLTEVSCNLFTWIPRAFPIATSLTMISQSCTEQFLKFLGGSGSVPPPCHFLRSLSIAVKKKH